jgi:proline racemase
MNDELAVAVVDYHTAGEPFRIVTHGVRALRGATMLERRRDAAENLDHVRRLVVFEPRGHADMYGCFVTAPDDAGADLGVVFFHNAGYSTACGHGTIAIVTWALETGVVPLREPVSEVTVDVPSGRLHTVAQVAGGRVRSVRFRNVPAFVEARGVPVATSRGPLQVDLAYGGAFYASLPAADAGLAVCREDLPGLIALGREIKHAVEAGRVVEHPLEPELHGVYGAIFWQPEPAPAGAALCQRNVTVFADGEVDRSPCGSGTSARLALLDADGTLARGESLHHLSITDQAFSGRVVADSPVEGRVAVVTEVEGSAYRTGAAQFALDPRDPLGTGFLLR